MRTKFTYISFVLIAAAIFGIATTTCTAAQTAPSAAPIDRFLGTWKLTTQKAPGVPEHESIKIERVKDGIKFTHDISFESDTELNYWGVMNSKGAFVTMTQTNGKPMNEQWRITHIDKDTLVIEERPILGKKEYKLSTDGQTMTERRTYSASLMNKFSWPVLSFQKLP